MKKIIKKLISDTILLDLIFIFCLSLVTLNWTKPDQIIDGNDTIYPLRPIPFFQERLYQWKHTIGAGVDFSYGSAGLIWHGLQALIAKLGVNIFLNQKIFILFWFNAISFSFYFLASVLLPGRKKRLARIAGTVFYSFNPYLFNLWSNIQAANLSAYVFLPLGTGLIIKAFQGAQNFITWIIVTGLSSMLCCAMGMNPQVVFIVFLHFLFFFIFILIRQIYKRETLSLSKTFKIFAVFLFVVAVFNSFWIIPELRAIVVGDLSLEVPSSGKLRGWLDALSLNTSPLNVIRMQGEWTWYSEYKEEPYIPFAINYQTNPILLVVSFLAFSLSVLAILKSRNSWLPFFAFILLFGLMGSIGIKPPFGYFYLILTEKIKIFSFLRSPWYKFTLLTGLSYAVLVSFFAEWLLDKRKSVGILVTFLAILGQLIYSYPLITGEVVPDNFKILPPYRFSIPDYVWKADEWLRADNEEAKIVVLPYQGERDFYRWGYGAPFQLLNLLSNPKPILNGSGWTVIKGGETNRIVDSFYDALFSSRTNEAVKILSLLNVKYLVQKNDFYYDFDQLAGSPTFVKKKIEGQKHLKKVSQFGNWDIYEIEQNLRLPLIYPTQKINYYSGDSSALSNLFLIEDLSPSASILDFNLSENVKTKLNKFNPEFYFFPYLLQKNPDFWPITPFSRFSPKHPAYLYVRWKEENTLKKTTVSSERISLALLYAGKRVEEIEILRREDLSEPSNKKVLKKVIDDYIEKLKIVENGISGIKSSSLNKAEIELLQGIEISLESHKSKLTSLYYLFSKEDKKYSQMIYEIIIKLTELEEKVSEIFKAGTSSLENKKYKVEISKEGFYDLLLFYPDSYYKISDNWIWKIKVGDVEYKTKGNFLNNNCVLLPDIFLKEGETQIEINFPKPANLLPTFKSPYFRKEGEVSFEEEEGEKILVLKADKTTASARIKLANLDLGKRYTVSFWYKTFSLNTPRFVISSPGNMVDFKNKITYKRDGQLDFSSTWREYKTVLEPDNDLGDLELNFLLEKPLIWEDKSLAKIKGIKVYQDYSPPMILKFKKEKLDEKLFLPQIYFTKVDPTKYEVDVKNAKDSFILVFSENFHPSWEAFLRIKNSPVLPIPKENHLKVNGFANGWFIDQKGDFQVILEYNPQRLYRYLLSFSFGGFFLSLVFILIKFVKK